MYSYISGTLVAVEKDYIVVDNHGIGYRLFVPSTVTGHIPGLGEQVKIYTYLSVREDAMQLFGFSSQQELDLFRLLIGVNGIGPKGALGILSVLSAEDLRFAVLAEDTKAICQAPGIGKKTAQRLILDLKDKIRDIPAMGLSPSAGSDPAGSIKSDVIEAMTSLGYSASETLRAMEDMEITSEDTLEDVIKEVLKKLSFL
jgi:Holliday junction DNA helicase RuvA